MIWLSVVLAALGAIANLGVAGVYMYLHRGWKDNTFAKLFIPNLLAEGALFVWLSVGRLLPTGEYRPWISIGFYTIAVGVMLQRAYAYLREEIKLDKELDASDNVGLDQRPLDLQPDTESADGSGVRGQDQAGAVEPS